MLEGMEMREGEVDEGDDEDEGEDIVI